MVSAFANQRLVFFVAFLRMRELEELHLLKLVLAQDAARIFSRRASLGAEARRPRGHVNRQFFLGNRFVAVEIVQLRLRSWA